MLRSRQLAAIMFTDIAGYTALMGEDENKALSILNKNRQLHIHLIESFNGKLIKELGDGVLASFSTVADAVLCACRIQLLRVKITGLHLRIGIHLGDILFENNDVFGDGVNVASRLQALAPIDGIYISEAAQKIIANKKEIQTKFIAEEKLKNVKNPVCVYEVLTKKSKATVTAISNYNAANNYSINKPREDKSIAVLPFLNISSEPEQEYFSDGIAEEILNSLAQLKNLKVAGRSSSFQFRGKGVDIQEVGKKLKVATVLEGSVQRQANKLRITVQLINTEDGFHLWSEKYDRALDDIFAVQDEIALAISQKLKITLLENEIPLVNKSSTKNKEAYDLYLKGLFYWNRHGPGLKKGLMFFQQAVEKDPEFAPAHSGLAQAYVLLAWYSILPPHTAMPKAKQSAEKAIQLDPSRVEPHSILAMIMFMYDYDWVNAKKQFQKALSINSDDATTHYWYSNFICFIEKDYTHAIKEANKAIEFEPLLSHCHNVLCSAYLCSNNFEEARKASMVAIDLDASTFLSYNALAMSLICLKEYNEAANVLETGIKVSERHQYTLFEVSWLCSITGNLSEAKKIYDELVQRSSTEFISGLSLCVAAYNLKEYDKSVEYLEIAFKQRAGFLPTIASFPIFSFINKDSRFQHIIEQMKFPN